MRAGGGAVVVSVAVVVLELLVEGGMALEEARFADRLAEIVAATAAAAATAALGAEMRRRRGI